MDEIVVYLLLIALVVFSPFILSIIALVRTNRIQRELEALGVEMRSLSRRLPAAVIDRAPSQKETPAMPEKPAPAPITVAQHPAAQAVSPGVPPPAPSAIKPPSILETKAPPPPPPSFKESASAPDHSFEMALGGKGASFIGIAVFIMGVVFFVGYAIQHQWIGPGLRVILGLLAGGLLVAGGYVAETRGKNLRILARALTGGGAALFYFSVFAAHGIYNLINAWGAGAGLVASAAAVLALAVVYNSQAVAVLGVLGAFIMPLLIGGDFSEGLFPLIFIAVVNVPVILLGLRRKWQWFYNLAFVFTVFFTAVWLDRETPAHWGTGLFFCLLFFGEFVMLGLLKLKSEAEVSGRALDIIRLGLASLFLMGALYWILTDAELKDWIGAVFLTAALLHVALARIGWTWMPRFKQEILAFLVAALSFATLALPAQLDGVWVSLGWALEGVVLAWFALRIQSPLLQTGAVLLGMLGLMKSLVYDISLYPETPRLFLNARFMVGMGSAALLGAQGWLHARISVRQDNKPSAGQSWLMCAAWISILVVLSVDTFTALDIDDPWPWLITSIGMIAVGFLAIVLKGNRPVERLGFLLLGLLPLKLVIFDLPFSWDRYEDTYSAFGNSIFWLHLMMLLVILFWITRQTVAEEAGSPAQLTTGPLITIFALLSGIVIISAELFRMPGPWGTPLVTLWWAICALALAITGLVRRRAYLRYVALFIFGATLLKVLIIDIEGVKGLQRIAAFMGVGLLLLILSFAYQKVAPMLLKAVDKNETKE
ncbi:MAG: DUF2339 domain-containing protein [Lentisphaerota bacterium]